LTSPFLTNKEPTNTDKSTVSDILKEKEKWLVIDNESYDADKGKEEIYYMMILIKH